MGPGGIAYSGLAALTIALGGEGNSFTIASTAGGLTTLSAGGGNDKVSVQATGGATNLIADRGAATIQVGSAAPSSGGVLDGVQGTLTVAGGGSTLLVVDDTGASGPQTGRLTSLALTGLGMGPGGIAYSGLAALTIALGGGGNTFTVDGMNAAATTSIDGGNSGSDSAVMALSGDFAGVLRLTAFEQGTVTVNGSFQGTLIAPSAQLAVVTLGRSMTSEASLTVAAIGAMSVADNLAGRVAVSGPIRRLTVGGEVAGSVTSPATIDLVTIGGKLTETGVIDARSIGSLSIHGDLAGKVDVSRALGVLGVGGTLTRTGTVRAGSIGTVTVGGNLSGTVVVTGDLGRLTVTRDLYGTVRVSGTIAFLKIGGSLARPGVVRAGNIDTLSVGIDLAGTVVVTGRLRILTIGRDLSGSVRVSGTIDVVRIGRSLTRTGVLAAGNIKSLSVGSHLAGKVVVKGRLGRLTVGRDISGSVKAGRIELLKVAGSLSPKGGVRAGTIKSLSTGKHLRGKVVASGRLSRLNVGGALSGSVGVSKAANRLEIGGSLKRTGVVTAAQVNTLTVGGTLAGKVAVGGELKHITIHADLTGSVSESRGIESIFIGGSFTRTGVLRLLREPRRELPRVAIGGDVKGTVISTSAPRSAAVVRKPQNLGRRPARRRGLLSLLASQDWRGPPPTLQDDDWEHIRKRHWPGTEHTEPDATKFEGTYLVATTGRFASLNRGELVNLIAVTCATGFTRWTWNRIECQKKYDWIVGVQRNGDFCKYLWVVVRRHPNTVETAYPICKRKLKEDGGPDG